MVTDTGSKFGGNDAFIERTAKVPIATPTAPPANASTVLSINN